MFITQLVVNRACGAVRKDLNSAYDMHRTIYNAFASVNQRLLYRVENSPSGVLIYSDEMPNWSHLGNGYTLYPPVVRSWQPQFDKNQWYKFSLVANPTVKRNGKRYPVADSGLADWIENKLMPAGLVEGLIIQVLQPVKIKKPSPMVFHHVRFDGALLVKNADELTKITENGIGSAKGFGFGLILCHKI